jgi:hypothetical protein
MSLQAGRRSLRLVRRAALRERNGASHRFLEVHVANQG